MVDTRAPQTYMHLHLKLKKLQVCIMPYSKTCVYSLVVWVFNRVLHLLPKAILKW